MSGKQPGRGYHFGLVLSALGVVYGDIGTSPLYAFKECFLKPHGVDPTRANVLGLLSLITWSLFIIVSIKYLLFVMRANNRGEGGILALLSLAFPEREKHAGKLSWKIMISMGIFGAALLYGDGIITPAISVLSAVEGLNVATDRFVHYVVPITIVILIGLFSFQSIGTGRVGRIFGPVMLLWFATIAVLGLSEIVKNGDVIRSINPWLGIQFLIVNGKIGFIVLGAVFLVVTGGEALYADMGHFGVKPIRAAWFSMVLPALLLNYYGQAALVLRDPAAIENPFYLMAPSIIIYPLVALATLATVIASQALISGAFSLTMQAIQMGYAPRLKIEHTSSDERGQIYIPQVNWFLMIACIGLVLGFRSASALAAAYGIAVTLTMMITTVLFYFAARKLWRWPRGATLAICCSIAILELAFFAANCVKIANGGWFPLLVGALIFTLMTTWKTGRQLLGEKLRTSVLPFSLFLEDVQQNPPTRVHGTAVFLSGNADGTPLALLHNLKHNKVIHEKVVLLTIFTLDVPHVPASERVKVELLTDGFNRVSGYYGFMEEPNVPELLGQCEVLGLKLNPHTMTYFLSRETIIPTKECGMAMWREQLFAFMAGNAQRATAFFRLPANRVVELGMQVEM
ncbi:MAG: potassium transporter Kup [Verrucomicrobiales bacterium]|nr:potassium transporter Kup [Verrucomicrobiales bacterium]